MKKCWSVITIGRPGKIGPELTRFFSMGCSGLAKKSDKRFSNIFSPVPSFGRASPRTGLNGPLRVQCSRESIGLKLCQSRPLSARVVG